MRKYQQTLMVMVTFVVIIAFAWLYNDHDFGKRGTDTVGVIYGRKVSQPEFIRIGRKFEICQMLGLYELLSGLASVGPQQSRGDFEENFIWNNFVLRYEADKLGIVPTDQEIIAAVQKIRAFETAGVYDSAKYAQFVENGLTPRGMSAEQLEEIVADSLRLEKIKALLGATNDPVPSELRQLFEKRNQKTELSVIRLKLEDFKKDLKISDEDVAKRFEERKATLLHSEKRKVKFVAFKLPEQQPPLANKERVAALQKLADQASEFAVAMTAKDAKLEEEAAKFGGKVEESPEFEADAPPKELAEAEAVAEAAFKLTKEEPNSDVVTTEQGYFALQLAEIKPSTPMTLDEAKKELTEEMVTERATEALTLKASEFRNKITEAIKGGKTFADAAKEVGASVEPFPAFSQAEPKMEQPDAREIMPASADLAEGQISEFVPTMTGGVLLHVDKRLPVDETNFEKEKTMLAQSLDRNKREAAFQLWMKDRRAAAGVGNAQG